MKKTSSFVGIDLGGESGRVVVGTFDGEKIELNVKHRFPTGGTYHGSDYRWEVEKFWQEIQTGLKLVAEDTRDIVSIGVDTWGVDYALLDSDDQLIELPFHYRDKKNVGTLAKMTPIVSRPEIFSQTGIQFMEINTLCQLFAHKEASDALNNAETLLTMADYFHWCLCGAKSVEFTFATTTQCFDPTTRDWAFDLLKKLDLPTSFLPKVIQPGTNLGSLSSEVEQATGLKSVSVVAPATHDTGSAIAAVPVSPEHGKNWAYISSGTWSLVGVEIDEPILSEAALAANVTNEGGVEGTWRLLKNVMGLWIVQRLKQAFADRGFDQSYQKLTEMAGQADSPRTYIDPDNGCFLNPDNMEQAIIDFCQRTGQTPPASEASMVRCVLESLALRYCEVLREIEGLTGNSIDVVHVVGGGCQNILLNQFISGATQIPVIAGPSEATVLGNILVQCKSAGQLESLADIRQVVRNSVDLIDFQPNSATYWRDALKRFKQLCADD